uniref:Uncharacterized protein n=1 Tax=Rhizophora mucronata TaxID=61149 RepID=A0A2P2PQF7_RHIMU
MEFSDASESILKEWSILIEDSKQSARREFSLLVDQMSALGWTVKNILLSTEEQARYGFIDD